MEIKWFLLVIYLVSAVLINSISSNYISKLDNLPIANDRILGTIDNEYPYAMTIAEIIILFCFITFGFIFFQEKEKRYEWIFIFASFQMVRGLLLPLTILGNPSESLCILNDFETFSFGMFPSGHTAIPFLFFLFTYQKNKMWIFYLFATLIVGWLLLLGKQHYTIDVISTIFIAYSIKCFTEKNIQL